MSKTYIQIAFNFNTQDQLDMLVAQLADLGFDGFNEEEAATGINNGVGMSSILGATTGLGAGAGHCKTFILATDYEAREIEKELEIINERGWDCLEPNVVERYENTIPALHINHGKHFTSHYQCYKQPEHKIINFWGDYHNIWNNSW